MKVKKAFVTSCHLHMSIAMIADDGIMQITRPSGHEEMDEKSVKISEPHSKS